MEVFVVVGGNVKKCAQVTPYPPTHSLQIDRECGCHKGISGKIYSIVRVLVCHTHI